MRSPVPFTAISNDHVSSALQSSGKVETAVADTKTTSFVPTAEQERIYQHAKPPTTTATTTTTTTTPPSLVRITAGAGAGKTTTVLHVAARAARLGHTHITYVTFAKAAAVDGALRIQRALLQNEHHLPHAPTIEARTLHSCAMNLLSIEREEEFVEQSPRLMDEEALQRFIGTVCEREIQEFLARAKSEIISRTRKDPRTGSSMIEAAERQVIYFIFKTITQFCRSPYTVEQLKDPFFKYRNYYPAEIFHSNTGGGEKCGFALSHYRSKTCRYAEMACIVWDTAEEHGLRSYDIEMKRAQLKALRIPGSLLLVDESQDMDGCQVDWISKQCNHGTHVYIVGDAAQTIYSFRGAKSKYMVNLEGADFKLTKSWRFGTSIASAANVILYAKHKSKQTKPENPTWQPYRLQGCGREGIVTCDSILSKWNDMPITVIAAFNATLLQVTVNMLGLQNEGADDSSVDHLDDAESQDSSRLNMESVYSSQATSSTNSEEGQGVEPIVSEDSSPPMVVLAESASNDGSPQKVVSAENPLSSTIPAAAVSSLQDLIPMSIPKIHINGKGENSGMKKWKSVIKQIQHVYNIYKSGDDGYVFPDKTFPEFNGERHTWDSFCFQVETRELFKYASSIHVVDAFEHKTMEVMALFEQEVMDKKYSAEEADVVLSTAHAAKGMEFDNVQVCEDFTSICKLSCDGPVVSTGEASGSATRTSWQFQLKSWGDDVNLLYVACTRAKNLLAIPSSIKSFLQDCDMLHDFIRWKKLFKQSDRLKSSEIVAFGRKDAFSVQEALDVYQDVIAPLRIENKLQTKERLMKALIKPIDDEKDYDDDKSLEGDDDFERFFGFPSDYTFPATANTADASTLHVAVKREPATGSTEPVAKKPKLARAFQILEEAKKSEMHAPKRITRPYDKKEKSISGSANCRECKTKILLGTPRVGVQVYVQHASAWWPHYFHEKCFPKELLPRLRLDPNPKRTAKKKKSFGLKHSTWGGREWKGRGRRDH